ncbi:MAG TPA: polymer-forming cytoskeletal protein [Burkholderiales bacterium]|nr:polymer-forming cytoskeletal protein [Burkholderiales bacterium]
MLQSNPGFERGPSPERPASSAGFGAPRPAPTEDAEPAKIPVLGKTLVFRGELTAEEDVILQGRVEGSIRHARNLIIGPDGSVMGDVYASHLTVEGLVEGDLHCSEAVVVRATAQVRGNIFAPRVGIMEGATFNGRVEMDPNAAATQAAGARPAARQPAAAARATAASPPVPARPGGSAANASARAAGSPAGAQPAAAAAPLTNAAVDQVLNAPSPTKK